MGEKKNKSANEATGEHEEQNLQTQPCAATKLPEQESTLQGEPHGCEPVEQSLVVSSL